MSTTDPAARRNERLTRHQGSTALRIVAVLGLVLVAAGSACLGSLVGVLAEDLRTTHLVSTTFGSDTLGDRPWVPGLLLGCGMVGVLLGALGYRQCSLLAGSGEEPAPVGGPVGMVAATAALVVQTTGWEQPRVVGSDPDPLLGDGDWGIGSWVLYRMDLWLPALFVSITLLATWLCFRTGQVHRQQRADRNRLLTQGRRVPADVVDLRLRYSTDDSGSRRVSGAVLTVKYVDDRERDRWVERLSRGAEVRVGPGVAEVLYDPLRPDDESLVFVALRRDPLPSDWIGRRR